MSSTDELDPQAPVEQAYKCFGISPEHCSFLFILFILTDSNKFVLQEHIRRNATRLILCLNLLRQNPKHSQKLPQWSKVCVTL